MPPVFAAGVPRRNSTNAAMPPAAEDGDRGGDPRAERLRRSTPASVGRDRRHQPVEAHGEATSSADAPTASGSAIHASVRADRRVSS